MARVLVTGGAGYLGSLLVGRLLDAGVEVRTLDNYSYGSEALEPHAGRPGLELVEGDICHLGQLWSALDGVTHVIALAAIVGDPAAAVDEQATLNVNYESTKVLVELCNRAAVERLVFASSCSVYGAHPDLVLNEGSKLNPLSLYARTRIMSEDVIRLRADRSVSPVIVRLASLFGWSHRPRFDLAVNIMAAKARAEGAFHVHGGSQWRPFLHVADAAEAFLQVALADDAAVGGEIFNVGRDELNVRISDLADVIAAECPEAERVDHAEMEDRRDYRVSFAKLGACLPELELRRELADGIREIVREIGAGTVDHQDDRHYNVEYLYR